MIDSDSFYKGLAPLYHLIYRDWEGSIKNQAGMLDSVIREYTEHAETLLDVSCGIGTQALGMAGLGYKVKGSDLSPEEIERAKHEALKRNLDIHFTVADMRHVYTHHNAEFDVVISCDNSVPHLLTDRDILTAFREFYLCTRSGGLCVISVRDYEKEDLSGIQVKPYGVREEGDTRWLVWQVWQPRLPLYDVSMYFVEDTGGDECTTAVSRGTYYAVCIPRLIELMKEAGFCNVKRIDGRFFQPLITGVRRE